jgi:Cof subfamily protein (haloacid dehalogenase superfamily)
MDKHEFKHKVKLIASDMDGTLINQDRQISEENANAIKQAQEQGIHVVIATGRSYKEAIHLLKAAGIICPVICVNGAEIRSAAGEKLKSVPLRQNQFEQVQQTLAEQDIYYEMYTNVGTFSDNPEKAVKVIADIIRSANPEQSLEDARNLAKGRFIKAEITYTPSYAEILSREGIEIYKLLCFSMDDQKLEQVQNQLGSNETLAVSTSGDHNLEITDSGAQKGLALSEFAASLGISMEETMAIGDHYNDVSMLTRVGFSVAMGNAEAEIKAVSRFTTAPNTEHGVARAIQELALA